MLVFTKQIYIIVESIVSALLQFMSHYLQSLNTYIFLINTQKY